MRGHKPLFTYISKQVYSFYGSSYSNFLSRWNPIRYQFHHTFFSTYSHSRTTHSVNFNVCDFWDQQWVKAWLNQPGAKRKHHSKVALENRTWLFLSSTGWGKQQLSKYWERRTHVHWKGEAVAPRQKRRVDTAWGGMLQRHISWIGINNVTGPEKNLAVVLCPVKRTTVCKTRKAIILLCLAPDSSQL